MEGRGPAHCCHESMASPHTALWAGPIPHPPSPVREVRTLGPSLAHTCNAQSIGGLPTLASAGTRSWSGQAKRTRPLTVGEPHRLLKGGQFAFAAISVSSQFLPNTPPPKFCLQYERFSLHYKQYVGSSPTNPYEETVDKNCL